MAGTCYRFSITCGWWRRRSSRLLPARVNDGKDCGFWPGKVNLYIEGSPLRKNKDILIHYTPHPHSIYNEGIRTRISFESYWRPPPPFLKRNLLEECPPPRCSMKNHPFTFCMGRFQKEKKGNARHLGLKVYQVNYTGTASFDSSTSLELQDAPAAKVQSSWLPLKFDRICGD